jgi:hypothetical protein
MAMRFRADNIGNLLLIDLARESAKVARPVKVADVVDFSFVERARKDLGLSK